MKAIKVYYTGQLRHARHKDPSRRSPAWKRILIEKKTKIALSGDLKPGRNYLWVTADIADDATEGNRVAVSPPSGTTRTKGSNMNRNRQRAGDPASAGCYLLPATTIPTFTGSRPSLLPKMVLSSRQPTSARRIWDLRRISTWLSVAAPITVKRGATNHHCEAKDTQGIRDAALPDSATASFSASLGE